MHELPIIESILIKVIRKAEFEKAKKIIGINLRIGELTELDEEWMQRYFEIVSRNTMAMGAKLKIEWSPIIFRCEDCGGEFTVKIKALDGFSCGACGSNKVYFVSGREFFIKDFEVI